MSGRRAAARKHKKRVLAFGVFDRIHAGHCFFLRAARAFGEELFVAVARDRNVSRLKKKRPRDSERIRLRNVRRDPTVSGAFLGDKKDGDYAVLRKIKSDVICVGYDQTLLRSDILRKMKAGVIPRIPIIRIRAYRPKKFHTSFLSK
ncbi:MAG: adenylyltransferase/cytidyltransferase family protein [Candidatus Niyogibacteria bacterium]|nr:adenylyltransferase/cytidyltransferase family protein [Candidatus Niyogibacteria bacterium]